MKKQQTAVEWLVEKLASEPSFCYYIINGKNVTYVLKQAKEMERQQIIDAFGQGNSKAIFEFKILNGKILRFEAHMPFDGEKYYNETYGDEQHETSI